MNTLIVGWPSAVFLPLQTFRDVTIEFSVTNDSHIWSSSFGFVLLRIFLTLFRFDEFHLAGLPSQPILYAVHRPDFFSRTITDTRKDI